PIFRAAQNAASNGDGGVVFYPIGTFKVTGSITLYSGIAQQGASNQGTSINMTGTSEDLFIGTDLSGVQFYDIFLQGPNTGTGCGINLGWSGAGNVPYLDFRNIIVKQFGADGIKLETPILSTFSGVISEYNGGHGFNFYHAGTSCTFNSCWGRYNAQAGYNIYESVYFCFNGCASDYNGIGYLINSAQSIGFFGCGSENQQDNNVTYNGVGWTFINSSVCSLWSCWITGNNNLGVWVTGGSDASSLNVADNSPGISANYFIQTDSGTAATIYGLHNTTANSLSGDYMIVDDGAGEIVTQNIFANAQTASTAAAFNSHKAIISSSTSLTQLNYLSGATGTTGSGALVLGTSPTITSLAGSIA